MSTQVLPETQVAVQLVGADRLELNTAKAVLRPREHEILIRVEACGLCFSDLKLLKQFSGHARKSGVVSGLSAEVLAGIQSYVPGEKAVVPGHEVVCRIVAVGSAVKGHKVGERCLVQTDYRDLPTASSASAFGYNFEGGLQEYCIVDERVVVDRKGDRFLIPVGEDRSASAVALVEPWACVEDSYVCRERQHVKEGGRLAVVADAGRGTAKVEALVAKYKPGVIERIPAERAGTLAEEGFDDIIYFGSDPAVIETLNDKLATRGTFNLVLGGKKIGRKVNIGVGRVHYGLTRWVGTTSDDPAESYKVIPANTEIRKGEKIVVIGAGGPMGQMHIIRNACSGVAGISQVGTDVDAARIASLEAKAGPLAKANGSSLKLVNTTVSPLTDQCSYWALMAPVAALVDSAIAGSLSGAIINIFAGIPAPVKHPLDMDTYVERGLYMFGTSGSTIEDMKIVLRKVEGGALDTNLSLDAISGMAGARDGIKAIENRTLAGKIIVYPMLHDVPLIPLAELGKTYPTVAAKMKGGLWNREAEVELLKVAGK